MILNNLSGDVFLFDQANDKRGWSHTVCIESPEIVLVFGKMRSNAFAAVQFDRL